MFECEAGTVTEEHSDIHLHSWWSFVFVPWQRFCISPSSIMNVHLAVSAFSRLPSSFITALMYPHR